MNPPSRLLTRSFMVGVLILSTTYGASALTVKRTNMMIDGAYVPVLVVKDGGQTYIHQIGDDGLTRAIMFNRKKALVWARDKYGAEITDATVEDSGGGGGGSSIDRDDDDDGSYCSSC
jgi:hypothetical protein